MNDSASDDPVELIASALAAIRGQGMFSPRPPFSRRPEGPHKGAPDVPAAGPHLHAAHHSPHGGPHAEGAPGRGRRFAALARIRLLEALARSAHPLSVGEIAEKIGVDQPRASRLVQQVVDEGHARREADPDDARRTRIALTDEGAAMVADLHRARRRSLEGALAEFTPEEAADLARLLQKLARAGQR